MSKESVITEFKAWLTPLLIVVIGWFAKNKLESIDERLKVLESLQTEQAVIIQRVTRLEADMNNLEGAFYAHTRIQEAKDEEEITLNKLKRR